MPSASLTPSILLPELKLLKVEPQGRYFTRYVVEKIPHKEYCPRCATGSESGYDHRWVTLRDEPIRGRTIVLKVKKRRLWCKPCGKPFTEPLPGVLPKRRTTQRFRRSVLWACETFTDLKSVKKSYRCSNDFIYQALYESLELKRRARQYPWPSTVGIDEHAFRRKKGYGRKEFVSMIVDHKHKRLMEVVHGKSGPELFESLKHIPGRENVKHVTTDLADPYKSFVKSFFPNAQVTADKFHVLRLLNPAITKRRMEITGDRRKNPVRVMLLKNSSRLEWYEREALTRWLKDHPELEEVYMYKEALHRLYRTRGKKRAERSLQQLIDHMAHSKLKEIKTLRRTLMRWRKEVLNYFDARLTNARTEGFNNKAKVIKRRSYGFRSFKNYRLRLLNACA